MQYVKMCNTQQNEVTQAHSRSERLMEGQGRQKGEDQGEGVRVGNERESQRKALMGGTGLRTTYKKTEKQENGTWPPQGKKIYI